MDLSGYIDGYYSYNNNRPSNLSDGQTNQYYTFDDKTDQFSLEAAKFTLNHDPDPVGAHLDLIFGRTNSLIHTNSAAEGATDNYIEQAYLSVKPPKAKGFEMDFGQFATSAGQEVVETMNNWSYSHGLLFSYAIPVYHFGLRTSLPATKVWTVGAQLVNGWNNVSSNNGGVTIGLTSSLVKPKYTWNTNYYVGPSNTDTQNGYRNLIDTTLLLTPCAKFNAYVNYDYGQNRFTANYFSPTSKEDDPHWQGIAASARGQVTANAALVGRYEYFYDDQGFATAFTSKQTLQEFTGTYEYKWAAGLLMRTEYRYDWSDHAAFPRGNSLVPTSPTPSPGAVKNQSTVTVGLIAFFGPKR